MRARCTIILFLAGLGSSLADPVNLASGATVRQSSTYRIDLPDRTDPGIAIDGNISESAVAGESNRTATETNDPAPWLEVELERDALIESVEVFNLAEAFEASFPGARARFRDITIEVHNAKGDIIATSGLLNPTATATPGQSPNSLSHPFNLTEPARFVRVKRTPDPALPGQIDGHILYVRELIVLGEFVDPVVVRPFSVSFDSRRENPNPVTQRFQAFEVSVGSEGPDPDLLIDGAGLNAGIVTDGTETAWQVNDHLDDDDLDSPWYRQHFSDDDLRELYELGWTFKATLRIPTDFAPGTAGNGGFTGWGFPNASNPGWDTGGATNVRIGFDFGKTATGEFWVRPSSGGTVTFPDLHADEHHTITAVGLPGSTDFTWQVDSKPAETSTFRLDQNALGVRGVLVFGSGSTSSNRAANWKHVSLTAAPGFDPSTLDTGLRFHLPFARDGFLVERSAPPLLKPEVTQAGTGLVIPTAGVVGQGAAFPGPVQADAPSLDASPAVAGLKSLPEGTLSVWVKPEPGSGLRSPFRFSDSANATKVSYLRYSLSGSSMTVTFASENGNGPVGGTTTGTATNVASGTWHHLAVSVSATESMLYYDGQLLATGTSAFLNAVTSLDELQIGFSEHGGLDEIAIWNRPLSETEIRDLHRLGILCAPLSLDRDGDGLNHAEELLLGSSDTNLDSDGDTLADRAEASRGTSPALADTDGDTIHDGLEIATSALRADSDGDGAADNVDAAPLDPSIFPAPVLPPVPSLTTDGDGDGASDFAEVLIGTDPANLSSSPGTSNAAPAPAVLTATNFTRAPNGDVTFEFTAAGSVENLRMQSSTDLQSFADLPGALITSTGGGGYRVVIPTSAERQFFRAAGESAGDPVSSLITNLALPVDANGQPQTAIRVAEGATHLQEVQFSTPYLGYLTYTVAGLAPDGSLLPPIEHSVFVENATTATIPINIFNDLVPGSQARYTVTLTNTSGLATGIDSTFTVLVEDDDEVWSGVLSVNDEQVNIVFENYTDGTIGIQQLTAPDHSSLLPMGTFPVAATFDFAATPATFVLAAGNIPLARQSGAIAFPPAIITCLELAATDTPNPPGAQPAYDPGAEIVLPTRISGALEALHLAPDQGAPAEYAGTFSLIKRPQAAPGADLNLQPSSN